MSNKTVAGSRRAARSRRAAGRPGVAPGRRGGAAGVGRPSGRKGPARWLVWAGVAVVVVGVLFVIFSRSSSSSSSAGGDRYAVGSPGPGQAAPGFALPATTGGSISSSQLRGRTVLLYFQEGITCQACWDQMVALDHSTGALRAAGVDQVISITTDPVGVLAQKARDEGITTPVLSDPALAASNAYHANDYGMMGTSRDGHTFILVGPNGLIRWRADYGGAPNYTMDVPVPTLLRQLRAGELPG